MPNPPDDPTHNHPPPARIAATLRELELRQLNAGRTAGACVQYDATIPLGPEMRVERYVLGNGLRVLILQDHAAPIVALQVWVGVGSRHEVLGKTGLAHLFEHLMFGEAEGLGLGDFTRRLEEAGGSSNAATWTDWTAYTNDIPSAALPLALELEVARFSKLLLVPPQVAREKDVVANERRERSEDDADGAIYEALGLLAFTHHSYGRPTVGSMADIQGLTVEDCRAFYRTYYAPNNAVIVIVGGVATLEALRLVQNTFGQLSPSTLPVEDVQPEPPQTSERVLELVKGIPTARITLGYKGPALGDVDHVPLELLNEVLFGGRASRVHRRLVQELEIAADVGAGVGIWRDPCLYNMGVRARGEQPPAELLAALDEVLAGARSGPVLAAELERAKARLERATVAELEHIHERAFQIGFLETVARDPGMLWQKIDRIRAADAGDLLRVARRYLVSTSRTVICVQPGEEGGTHSGEVPGEAIIVPPGWGDTTDPTLPKPINPTSAEVSS